MSSKNQLQRGGGSECNSDELKFNAKLVLHVIYENDFSAKLNGHRRNSYATVNITDKIWFDSKDAFMAAVCKSFERLWDEMNE